MQAEAARTQSKACIMRMRQHAAADVPTLPQALAYEGIALPMPPLENLVLLRNPFAAHAIT